MDTITFYMGQDFWQKNAEYTIKIDGKQFGGVQQAGRKIPLTIETDLKPGGHEIEITFTNDGWGGTAATDRNLLVYDIEVNGESIVDSTVKFTHNGSKDFAFEV